MAQQQLVREERSLGELFTELAGEMSTLVRQEVALAQTEVTVTASKAGKSIGSLVVGGAVAYLGLISITAAVVLGLSHFIPAWAAALAVGVVILVGSYALISSALANLMALDPVPNRAIESIKEDAKWLKNEVM